MEKLINCPVCNSEYRIPFMECRDHFLTGEIFMLEKCTSCGLIFTNPRPAAKELGPYYKSTDYISHSNSKAGLFSKIYQLVRQYTLNQKYLTIHKRCSKGGKILDIGCATGEFLNLMKSKGWQVAGVEPDADVRKIAAAKYGLTIYDENEMENLEKGSYDVITLWHVLEHVSALRDRMESLQQLLAPGGILIIAVPNPESHDAIHYKSYWAGYDVPRHLYHFTTGSLLQLTSQFSFSLLEIVPMKFDAFYVSLLSEKYLHGKMSWIRGGWTGIVSNIKASRSKAYSSLIYIHKKGISQK